MTANRPSRVKSGAGIRRFLMIGGVVSALGATFVREMAPRAWRRMSSLVEAEGAILCFIVYLIPGLPKDFGCYLFGVSPMPFWVFAVVSTLGRMPGTWILSAQGAKAAAG